MDETKTETHGQTIVRRFESYGFWGGLALGAIVGVLISGPNFHEWAAETSALVVATCTLGGGIIGFFAGPIATASLASGHGGGLGGSSAHDSNWGDGGGGDGGGGGGGD